MNDCVPYAIHAATGIEYNIVLDVAKPFGWDREGGMTAVAGWCVLRHLGVAASSMRRPATRTTLARFLARLEPTRTYIIDVNEHWFAVRAGMVFDKANTHPRTVVRNYIELPSC